MKLTLDTPIMVRLTDAGRERVGLKPDEPGPGPVPLWQLIDWFPADWGLYFEDGEAQIEPGREVAINACSECRRPVVEHVQVNGKRLCSTCAAEEIRQLASALHEARR